MQMKRPVHLDVYAACWNERVNSDQFELYRDVFFPVFFLSHITIYVFLVFRIVQLHHLVQFPVCFWKTLFRRSQSPQVPAHRTLPLLRQTILQPCQASRHQRLLPALHRRKRSPPAVGWGFFRAIKRKKKNPEQTSKQVNAVLDRCQRFISPQGQKDIWRVMGHVYPPLANWCTKRVHCMVGKVRWLATHPHMPRLRIVKTESLLHGSSCV